MLCKQTISTLLNISQRRISTLSNPLAQYCKFINHIDYRPVQYSLSSRRMSTDKSDSSSKKTADHDSKINLKDKLTDMQYQVTQNKHTESPFSGRFDKFFKKGTYICVVCETALFESEHKFDSGCGWPAFFDSIDPARIRHERDESYGRIRTEVLCANCGAHLGHVFDDGPKPTGRRFCINSVSMKFRDPGGSTIDDSKS